MDKQDSTHFFQEAIKTTPRQNAANIRRISALRSRRLSHATCGPAAYSGNCKECNIRTPARQSVTGYHTHRCITLRTSKVNTRGVLYYEFYYRSKPSECNGASN